MKVAIVGYTPSRKYAPFDDPEFEIWGMNDLYKHIPRYTRWFDIHGDDVVEASEKEGEKPGRDTREKRINTFKTMLCPIYMTEKHPDVPNSVAYPLDEILDHFGNCFKKPKHAKYFTNTVSYMIALAIYEGAEELHIYGIDMATSTEYETQKPSCEFWLGVAAGRGIKIHVPDEADLLKAKFLYGYEEKEQRIFENKMHNILKDLENKKKQAIEQKAQWGLNEAQYAGAIQGIKEMLTQYQ